MKLTAFVLPIVALINGIASAQTPTAIPIINPSFIDDQLQCTPGASCFAFGITGWLCGPNTGMYKASTAEYRSAPPEGLYLAAIGGTAATGSIMQTLGDTVQANVTYVLKVTVGARTDYAFTGYQAALMAGGTILASGNNATPVGGEFATDLIAYSSGAAPAQLGQPLQIFVKSVGKGQVDVGSVTLTSE